MNRRWDDKAGLTRSYGKENGIKEIARAIAIVLLSVIVTLILLRVL